MASKEKLLEKKVSTLERRLVLIERFVELRFCETFTDFTIRNSGKGPTGPGNGSDAEPELPANDDGIDDSHVDDAPSSRPLRSTRQSSAKGGSKPGPACSKKASSTGRQRRLKDCVVRVIRTPDIALKKNLKEASETVSESPGGRRYGTRRQTRILEEPQIIKNEVSIDIEDGTTSSTFLEMQGEGIDTDERETGALEELNYGDEDDGDEYFTYPADSAEITGDQDHEIDNPIDTEIIYQDDDNWSEGGDNDNGGDDSDAEFQVKQTGNKRKPTKRKTQLSTSRGKKRVSEPRKRSHIYYLTSMADLPQDTKIVSTDSTREECPICKQFWKVEFIQQHIASHTKERHLKCPHCDKRYSKTDDLRSHLKMKHNREKYYPKCRICHEPIVRKMILHEKYCIKKTLQKGEHVDESLVEDIRQKCKQAGLEFILPDETVPPGCDPAERVQCPHCRRYFQRRNYDRHVKSHSLARNWKCSKCTKAYIHKHDLIRHMCIIHEASLKCELCGETCESRELLRTHKLKCRKSKGLVARPKLSSRAKAIRAIDPSPSFTENEDLPVSASNVSIDDQQVNTQEELNASEPQVVDEHSPGAEENEAMETS